MMIRTIAAAAAVALASLAAAPSVAMASTSGASTSGSGPRLVKVDCSRTAGKARGPVVRAACCAQFIKRSKVSAPSGGPRTVTVATATCCPPFIVSVPFPAKPVHIKPVHIKHVRVKNGVTAVPVRALGCGSQPMTFDMQAFASTATEVSGPHLTTHELMIYKHQVFMIRSVEGRTFTLSRLATPVVKPVSPVRTVKLGLFTNGATPISDGHAVVLASPGVVVFWQRR
jgi:hypothetical protein